MADITGSAGLDTIKAPLFREVRKGEVRKHIITLTVRNELGVLARIATLIAGKGYNIEGLSVGETHEKGISRMTLEVIGDDVVIDQVVKQLRKLIDSLKVKDLTDTPHVERELALIKVHTAAPRARDEVLRLVEIFRARVVDVSPETYTVEITGTEEKINAFIDLVRPFGIREMARTGKVAMKREGTPQEEE
ncbi:MAG: acetolactate synthase small subunit [Aquificaceae bacterium]|nr:acetolactate synthase small subunit [Aquificaceae bacterium]MCS7195698.1 acetolactate synthase small subunit [Aquificaceae bacterium]MCX7990122.1 acetolactate synthase small subunit [Aquificaceae bacterium]MDW8033132.1 acetolactate synthase small subunit [Aquificaceae bacterium]MDW8293999.1 acetolactate synthase small subunit [Aquificaceae bacterium]